MLPMTSVRLNEMSRADRVAPRPSRDRFRDGTRPGLAGLPELEDASDRPEAQGIIREGIRRGLIRATPDPRDRSRVRLVRVPWKSSQGLDN